MVPHVITLKHPSWGTDGSTSAEQRTACWRAGTARKMGCSIAMGKSVSSTLASCCAPSSDPRTTSFASPACHKEVPFRWQLHRSVCAAAGCSQLFEPGKQTIAIRQKAGTTACVLQKTATDLL